MNTDGRGHPRAAARTASFPEKPGPGRPETKEFKLRRGGDGYIIVSGGNSFWRSLARPDLIDEYRVTWSPTWRPTMAP